MRIAILGSHGSGKTTFLKRVHSLICKNHEVLTIPDVARLSPLPVGYPSSTESQQWIMETQATLERLTSRSEKSVLFDNCCIGHLAYFEYWGGDVNTFAKYIRDSQGLFSHVLYLPPQPRFLVADGTRPTETSFQDEIADRQLRLLEYFNWIHATIPQNWPEWTNMEWEGLRDSLDASYHSDTGTTESQFLVIIGLVRHNGRILMNRRCTPQIPDADGKWELPGGRIDFGESASDCIRREILEETGYLVSVNNLIPILGSNVWHRVDGKRQHAIVACYDCSLVIDQRLDVGTDDEARDVTWFTREEAIELELLPGIRDILDCCGK